MKAGRTTWRRPASEVICEHSFIVTDWCAHCLGHKFEPEMERYVQQQITQGVLSTV